MWQQKVAQISDRITMEISKHNFGQRIYKEFHLRLQMTEKVEMRPQKGFGPIVIWIPSGRYLNIAKSALA